ncbi:recombinase family protein [Streptomyces albulus]|nr:recombinase family protein [Streptomyces noursei]
MIRAIYGSRVSVFKGQDKTSHTVQQETTLKEVTARGWTAVGYFEDLDVSADKYGPWKRPDLGPWLTAIHPGCEDGTCGHDATEPCMAQWDAITFTKVDRVFRSAGDCADLARWCKKNKRILYFTDDNIFLDYSIEDESFGNSMAEIFLYLSALFAKIELGRIKRRSQDTHNFLKYHDRWPGGIPPYGYVVVPREGGGKTLAIDPETSKNLLWMAHLCVEGFSFEQIAVILNDQGIDSNRVRYLKSQGKTVSGRKEKPVEDMTWSGATVAYVLRSPSSRGFKLKGREIAYGKDGAPIRYADPIFDSELWPKLETACKARERERSRDFGAPPLRAVAMCGECKQRMHFNAHVKRNKTYRYYVCNDKKHRVQCGVRRVAEEVEGLVEEAFLAKAGGWYVHERIYVPGEDHTEELGNLKERIKSLRAEKDEGLIVGEEDEAEYKLRLRSMIERRTKLEALPQKKATYEYRPTDQTYYSAWMLSKWPERRKLLVDAGVQFFMYADINHPDELVIPKDMEERLKKAA